jgi:hypothetical protein
MDKELSNSRELSNNNDVKSLQNNDTDNNNSGLIYVLMSEIKRMLLYDNYFQKYAPTAKYSDRKLIINCPNNGFNFIIDCSDNMRGCVVCYKGLNYTTKFLRFTLDKGLISLLTLSHFISLKITLQEDYMSLEHGLLCSKFRYFYPNVFYEQILNECNTAYRDLHDVMICK